MHASTTGKVKWFNGTKGYGFVTLENGGEAFCHASVLKGARLQELPPGATIVCELAESQRGTHVVAIHRVDFSTAAPLLRASQRDFGAYRFSGFHFSAPSSQMSEGKVRFFDDQKGFGYVMPDNGRHDVYLRAAALRRSGLQVLEPHQRVRFSTRQGNRGGEVYRVELIQ